jgi:hypothetical protein
MRTLTVVLLLAGLVLALSGCRTRRRPVIVVDAGTSEISLEAPSAGE